MTLQEKLAMLLKDVVIVYTQTKNTSTFMQKGLDKDVERSIHWNTEAKANVKRRNKKD